MTIVTRSAVLVLFVWLLMAGVCFGKQVYLKDGGIIDCQSAWRSGGKVYVKVNRDIIADFDQSEVNVRRTFPKVVTSVQKQRHKNTAQEAALTSLPPKSDTPAVPETPVSKPAAQPPVQPVQSAAPPVSNPVVAKVESPPPASPPDKAEQQRRSQEAAKMMAEALMSNNPELMKKAVELQKSTIPQHGDAARQMPVNPLKIILIIGVIGLLMVVAQWVIFERAGRAGWKSLIPLYNMYVLMEVAGKPGWWMILMFIPGVNVVIFLLAMLSLAKKFGRNELLGVGMTLLPMIFLPVLAFGGSDYEG